MSEVKNKYRYVLTDRFGTLEVAPLGEGDFSIQYEREDEGKYFYAKQFQGKITFTGVIFQRLRRIERSIYICKEQNLKVYRICTESEILIFDGYLKLTEGEWDEDKCKVELKFEKNTPDKCLKDNRSTKINLLAEVNPKITVKTATVGGGVFEYKHCHDTVPVNNSTPYGGYVWCGTGNPDDGNWVAYQHSENMSGTIGTSPDPIQNTLDGIWTGNTDWVREIVEVDCNEPVPNEWILVEDNCGTTGKKKYAKQATLYNCVYNNNYIDNNNYSTEWTCQILGGSSGGSGGSATATIDNGMHLNSAIQVFVNQFCPNVQVVSDFFQINPTIRKNLLKNADLTNNADGYYSWFYNPIGAAINGATTYNSASKSIRLDITSGGGQHPNIGIGCLINSSVLDFTQVKNKTITISYDVKTSSPRNVYPSAYSYQGYTILNQNTVSANNGTYKRVFVTVKLNNVNYSDLYFYAFSDSVWNSGDWLEFKNFKLEIGDTATEFQPNNIVTNYVTGQRTQTDNLILFQKSDVKRPNVSGNAWKAEWTFEKLMETLTILFNTAYSIENGVFRLEHISWFSRNSGLDLTQPKYEKWLRGSNKYTYDVGSIPQKEIFEFKESYKVAGFWNSEINYSSTCAIGSNKDNTKNYTVDDLTTDVELCLNNPSSDSSVVEDKGFVLIATRFYNGEYYILTESTTQGTRLNNTLSFPRLLRRYGLHNRPVNKGTIDGEMTTFLSTKPIKKGDKISVPLCCDNVFNPLDTVKTGLGNGIVDSAVFDLQSETLELELLYDVFNVLTNNVAPVLQGGQLSTHKNVPLVFPLNATDTDGIVEIINVKIPAYNGTVEVLSLTQAKYTPNLDYEGWDWFSLQAFDNWSEVSAPANFGIQVLPPNQPPVATNDSYDVFHGYPFSANPSIFANDSDDFGFSLVNANVVSSLGVSVTIDANTGNFTYVPPAGYEGVDTFQYQIQDGSGLTSTGTVTLNIAYKNKPVAVPDTYLTQKNTQLVTNGSPGKERLYANDYTPDGNTYSYWTTAETKPTAQGGTVTITADGLFTYNPPANYTGNDTFSYTVHNVNGSATGLVTISVIPTIYVKLVETYAGHESIIDYCGDPPQATLLGQNNKADYTLKFYSDAGGTVPFNVTGLNFSVNLREINSGTNNYSYDYQSSVLDGTTYLLLDDFFTYEELVDCNGSYGYIQRDVILLAGSYVII